LLFDIDAAQIRLYFIALGCHNKTQYQVISQYYFEER
jgi:hypothetical protein